MPTPISSAGASSRIALKSMRGFEGSWGCLLRMLKQMAAKDVAAMHAWDRPVELFRSAVHHNGHVSEHVDMQVMQMHQVLLYGHVCGMWISLLDQLVSGPCLSERGVTSSSTANSIPCFDAIYMQYVMLQRPAQCVFHVHLRQPHKQLTKANHNVEQGHKECTTAHASRACQGCSLWHQVA